MRNFVFVVFGFIAIGSLSSCNGGETNTIEISSLTREFCDYKEGSFWVYESEFGVRDTHRLYKRVEQRQFDDEDYIEDIGLWLTTTHNPSDTLRMGIGPFVDGGGNVTEYQHDDIFSYYATFFHFPGNDAVNVENRQPDQTLKLMAIEDSFEVGGNTYRHVRRFQTTKSSFDMIQAVSWAKNIGKITYLSKDTVNWYLVDYNVSQ